MDLPSGSYDAIVMSGGFSKEHVPVKALYEIARLLKTGK